MSGGESFLPSVPGQDYSPVHNVGRALIDAASVLNAAAWQRAEAVGISGPQWVVLIRIGGGIGATASALCRNLGYDSGSMTRMLDRLVRLGLVQRCPSAEDGRAVTLSLTEAGQALYPRLVPIAVEVLDQHLRGFSAGEIEQLMMFLDRIIANGEGHNPIS